MLHNAFVQDAIEFLMLAMVPTEKKMALTSYHDLIKNESFQFPEWMDPLIRISYFLHFFRRDIQLTDHLLKEIHQATAQNHAKYHLDNIVVIRKVPCLHSTYTRGWFVRGLFKLLKKHKVSIIDPKKDIVFMPDEEEPDQYYSVVMITDGFSHLREDD